MTWMLLVILGWLWHALVVAQGLPFPGPGVKSYAVTGIAVTDAGNLAQNAGGTAHTCTLTNVTLATGNSVAIAGISHGLGGTLTATWNGNACTEDGSGIAVGNVEMHGFRCDNQTGATGSVVVTKTSAGDDSLSLDCMAVVVSGLTTHAQDQTATATTATSTTWSTGTTATTATANEALVAFLGADGITPTFGTWQGSFTRLQTVTNSSGSCCAGDYGYRVVAATGTYQGQTTGNTSANSVGIIMTFR